ncbi:L-piperidine-6-carboxylate dehydrogenase [Facilibium subflavum]|uniref:L-piperidine-6-carboxylate dehydrogenase n=1 Tax=Facilibium subflavum TaxID=2219058 RepID=UPI0013C3751E|nr:aldehyde dehydrogenase family protein [Facilibium subflavum]
MNSYAEQLSQYATKFKSDEFIETYNPANNELLAKVPSLGVQHLDDIIKQSQKAFLQWRKVPAPQRAELVRLIGDELRKNKDKLGSLVSLEMGKSKQEGDGEVQEMIDMADFAVGQARMLYGKSMHSERPDHRMFEQWHPLGVVGVISAYNFPVAVWSWNAFIATICGNSVVWKPSPKTPLCALAVQEICDKVIQEHGFPNVLNCVVSQSIDVSKALVDDKRINLVSFTGSTEVGRQVGMQVAKRFGKSLLELGGNNAAIIDETADLKLTIPAVVFGAVGTAGQRCTSLRRLIVHENIYDEVVTRLKNSYKQIRVGDPLDTSNLMGPLIDQHAVDNYQNAIDRIKALGGKIAFGGQVIDKPGNYVEPTLVEADPNWDIVNQENFCPILFVMPYKTTQDAIAINNQVDHGLSSAVFTQRIDVSEAFLSYAGSDCGIANVNIGTSGAEIGGAFGGEKHTGGGREAGSDAWKAYMRRQTVTANWSKALPLAQGIKFNLED